MDSRRALRAVEWGQQTLLLMAKKVLSMERACLLLRPPFLSDHVPTLSQHFCFFLQL